MTLQVIKAEDVRDGEPRWYCRDKTSADAAIAANAVGLFVRSDVRAKVHRGFYPLAIVDRPAPSAAVPANRFDCAKCGQAVKADEDGCCATCGRDCTIIVDGAQPPPVLDLDALAEAERAMTAGTWKFANNTTCGIIGPDSRDLKAWHWHKSGDGADRRGVVALRNAAPHLIAEARAAVALRAEIARLTAELAAARAVPPDVEEAIKSTVDGAEEAGRCAALGRAYPITKAPFWTVPRLKAAIARAISDATAAARADLAVAVHELGEVTRAYHVADDAIGEVCRLVGAESSPGAADVAGNDASRKRDAVAKVRALVEASKAVPDVEAAIDARDAEWQNRIATFHQGFDGDGCESGDPIDWTLSALSQAKCTVEDAVGDFIEGHAKRLCDAAGGVWHDEYDSWASQVHDVLNHLRGGEDGAVIDGRASQPATVGGLLATATVGSIVEWLDGDGDWNQAVVRVDDRIPCSMHRWWMAGRWCQYGGFDDAGRHLRLPARLVPAHLADADPATRGPIGEVPDVR